MGIYADIGVRPIINAAGTLTRMSGSLMGPEVVAAMQEAAQNFVDVEELHLAAGRRIAEIIGVEAAHVCNSATAGIALMAAASMTGTDRQRIAQLPDTEGLRSTFLVQPAHRNMFDRALLLSGGRYREVPPDTVALEQAIDNETAAVYYTFAWFCTEQALDLPVVAEVAHAAGIPVIVDVAAEVPPLSNLTRYAREGADLYTFSGGKVIGGPQSSGFILGRADLVEACRLNDCPNMGIGRAMKTDKETIAGLVKAIELYVQKDHEAEMAEWERRVQYLIDVLGAVPHVSAKRQLPFGTGQLIPHVAVTWDKDATGISPAQAFNRLMEDDPRIAVQLINAERYGFGGTTQTELRIHPHTLQPGEVEIVAERVSDLLQGG